MRRLRALAVALPLVLGACADTDAEQVRICEAAARALEGAAGSSVRIIGHSLPEGAAGEVAIHYRIAGADPERRLVCRFAGHGFAAGRLTLEAVIPHGRAPLTPIELFMLREYGLGGTSLAEPRGGEAGPERWWAREAALLAQHLVNAAALGSLYALLAVGYTLVHGIIRRFNLAFGEFAVAGAYGALTALALTAAVAPGAVIAGLVTALAMAMLIGGIYGLAVDRMVFRPLRNMPSQAILIATIGASIVLQEFIRLGQGAGERWTPAVLGWPLWRGTFDGFLLSIGAAQVAILLLAAVLFAGLAWLRARTALGRSQRAIADDPVMAGLCGVDVERTVGLTLALGGAFAGAAGMVLLLYYGGINFFTGQLIALKSLTAAILGGIGSPAGAIVGGFLVALFEMLWAGYLVGTWKDVAVFGLLCAVLILRPRGLAGGLDGSEAGRIGAPLKP